MTAPDLKTQNSTAQNLDSNATKVSKKKDKKDKKRKATDCEKAADQKKIKSDPLNIPANESVKEEVNANGEIEEISVEDPFEGKEWKKLKSFDELSITSKILKKTKSFTRPTPIQSVCWPILMDGRDIIGIAETGSGKTLAFALPALNLIHNLSKSNPINSPSYKKNEPKVLMLTPTRELALQIHEQVELFSDSIQCRSMCVFGGVSKFDQKQKIQAGVDVVIACPGRLHDLMSDDSISLRSIQYVVLDEADRLLDSGFEKEIKEILGKCGNKNSGEKKKQIAMFSATWPQSVEKLAVEYLSRAVKVTIGSQDLGANANIQQIVEVLQPEAKEERLLKLLKQYHSTRENRIIVFALYKKEAARLERFLQGRGWNCVCIQGDMSQDSRTKSFHQFKSGEIPLLIATDVAARGLDIPKVEYVINFTFPLTIEDYVHRIGRTGRAGQMGTSHTFFTLHDKSKSGELINLLKQTQQSVPDDLMAFGTTVKKKEHSAYGAFFKDIDPNVKGQKITFDSDSE